MKALDDRAQVQARHAREAQEPRGGRPAPAGLPRIEHVAAVAEPAAQRGLRAPSAQRADQLRSDDFVAIGGHRSYLSDMHGRVSNCATKRAELIWILRQAAVRLQHMGSPRLTSALTAACTLLALACEGGQTGSE